MANSTDNSIRIDAPLELVWRMTNDVRSWPDLFTEYAAIDVLKEDENTVRFRLTMVPDPDGTVWSWVSERTWDESTKTVRAHRVETGPFEYMRIYWDFDGDAQGTTMRWRQEFEAKPTAPFDDDAITKRINDNTAIQMKVIKEKIERAKTQG
ncbi:SRPBCC family protein [Streptomyces iranensis]|uniref:Aromatase n=1 Tax=Streptomyces iranensis TaxID=576784 RepID=A0A060ZKP1_9ACTN|nr:SRPBCC family protein [Streptomyces iranensis]MBP2060868.1 aromatase [Streptomyces iranensis]CDR06329.1 cyclase/dehydrase [Streptomyces iranensis]